MSLSMNGIANDKSRTDVHKKVEFPFINQLQVLASSNMFFLL